MVEPKKKPRAKKKVRKVNNNVVLIKNLVDIPDPAPKYFWAKESKLAKTFLTEYGEDLLKLRLPYALKSLAFLGYIDNLKGRITKCVLELEYKPDTYEKIEISETKSGEDAIINKKQNLQQWLK